MLGGVRSIKGEKQMIYKNITFKAAPFSYDLTFDDRITLVGGDSCQTAHCGRCKPRFVLGEFTSPIVPYRNLPQTPGGMTADCRSLV